MTPDEEADRVRKVQAIAPIIAVCKETIKNLVLESIVEPRTAMLAQAMGEAGNDHQNGMQLTATLVVLIHQLLSAEGETAEEALLLGVSSFILEAVKEMRKRGQREADGPELYLAMASWLAEDAGMEVQK